MVLPTLAPIAAWPVPTCENTPTRPFASLRIYDSSAAAPVAKYRCPPVGRVLFTDRCCANKAKIMRKLRLFPQIEDTHGNVFCLILNGLGRYCFQFGNFWIGHTAPFPYFPRPSAISGSTGFGHCIHTGNRRNLGNSGKFHAG